jgi:predicted transcriptional regulator
MDSNGNDPHLTAKIVSKYVAHHKVATDQLADLINTIHRAIGQLGQHVEPEEAVAPAVSVRRSVQHDFVICMDCGYRGKTLRRHINVRHGLSPDEYRERWSLKSTHPLTAPAYSERRSAMSKALGFGRRAPLPVVPAAPVEAAPTVEAAKPTRRRKTNPAAEVPAAADEPASVVAKPARTRRSRRVATEPEHPA